MIVPFVELLRLKDVRRDNRMEVGRLHGVCRLMTKLQIISDGSLLTCFFLITHLFKLNTTGNSGLGDKPQ